MRLNKATSHALRVLVACAQSGGELRKVAEMAQALDLSEQNVFKIVHLLSRAGLVAAERGRHGGVRLARPAEQIRVGDVVTAMEAMPQSTGEDGTVADATQAGHGALFDDAFEAFLAVLNQSTVADMARSQQAATRRAKSKSASVSRSAEVRAAVSPSRARRPRSTARSTPSA